MNAKIGIDFHGVIDAEPKLFADFCREIRKLGISVHVISGGPKQDVIRRLNELGVEYDDVWAMYDYYEAEGILERLENGSFHVPTELWDKAKAQYCAREGIHFHIDDSPVYGKYFAAAYCRYDMESDVCSLDNGVEIDFKRTDEAVRQVVALLEGIS